jgi:hypothetical protein
LASEICLVTAQRLKTTIANTKAANKLIFLMFEWFVRVGCVRTTNGSK